MKKKGVKGGEGDKGKRKAFLILKGSGTRRGVPHGQQLFTQRGGDYKMKERSNSTRGTGNVKFSSSDSGGKLVKAGGNKFKSLKGRKNEKPKKRKGLIINKGISFRGETIGTSVKGGARGGGGQQLKKVTCLSVSQQREEKKRKEEKKGDVKGVQ